MSEMIIKYEVFQTRMICEKCGKGEMIPSREMLTSYPPKYTYKCIVCGNIVESTYRYPYARFVSAEDLRESTGNGVKPDEPR